MKALITILILIISIPSFSNLNNYEKKFNEANELYSQNKFEDALNLYKDILAEGFVSPDLFYNTANTYYRLNNIGESIYYYEKALLLSPDNEDYKYNLELVNLRVKNKVAVLPTNVIISFFQGIITYFSAKFWAYLSLFLFVSFLSVFFIYIKSQTSKKKKIYFLSSIIILFASLSAMFFMQYQTSIINSNKQAIVIVNKSEATSSPNENASILFSVYEGYKVEIESINGIWCEIKLTDGKKAWLKKDVLKSL